MKYFPTLRNLGKFSSVLKQVTCQAIPASKSLIVESVKEIRKGYNIHQTAVLMQESDD